MGMTVIEVADRVRTDGDAYRFMEELRWGDSAPKCLHCDSADTLLITPKNGVSRTTRRGTQSERRVWRCRSCRRQFSVLTGTVFHGTKISLRKWVLVIFEMCASKNGVSAREIERKYGVCPRTAWFMMHRIRAAMEGPVGDPIMTGVFEADETFFGGADENKHASKRGGQRGSKGKTPVFTLINRHTGEVRSRVVPNITGRTLWQVMKEELDPRFSILNTDGLLSYERIGGRFVEHESVNHDAGEYVRGDVTINRAENFFSQLKRSIDGTHHHVSREHLDRYLAEFDYRHSTRKMSDMARMERLMGQVGGKRLTYKLVKT